MDQEKLINAFGVSEEELLIHGTAIAAVEARLLTGCADSWLCCMNKTLQLQ